MIFITRYFKSFRSKNYRIYYFGSACELINKWIQYTAIAWITYQTTGSSLDLGFVMFMICLPNLLFTGFAGIITGYFDKRKLLLILQLCNALQIILFAFLAWYLGFSLIMLIIFGLCSNIISSIEKPLKLAFVPELLEHKCHITNAIALGAVLLNLTRLIGPLIAGYAMYYMGAFECLFTSSFFSVLSFIIFMSIKGTFKKHSENKPKLSLSRWLKSMAYVRKTPVVSMLLLLVLILTCAIGPYTAMMPVIIKSIYQLGAEAQGEFLFASGLGAVIGSIFVAPLRKKHIILFYLTFSVGILSFSLFIFAIAHSPLIGMLSLTLTGMGLFIGLILSNAMIQLTISSKEKEHVLSLLPLITQGILPISILFYGWINQYYSMQSILISSSMFTLVTGTVILLILKRALKLTI